jgi:predicted RNA binding protein YcfA (HicA-like mRNA interferase family)
VPKLPRISGSDCVSVLRRLGFVQVRQRGSHVVLRRGQQGCVVPMHRELKVGTLAGLLRQAGVDADEFTRAWRG